MGSLIKLFILNNPINLCKVSLFVNWKELCAVLDKFEKVWYFVIWDFFKRKSFTTTYSDQTVFILADK